MGFQQSLRVFMIRSHPKHEKDALADTSESQALTDHFGTLEVQYFSKLSTQHLKTFEDS